LHPQCDYTLAAKFLSHNCYVAVARGRHTSFKQLPLRQMSIKLPEQRHSLHCSTLMLPHTRHQGCPVAYWPPILLGRSSLIAWGAWLEAITSQSTTCMKLEAAQASDMDASERALTTWKSSLCSFLGLAIANFRRMKRWQISSQAS
jgi:hypothetical protein